MAFTDGFTHDEKIALAKRILNNSNEGAGVKTLAANAILSDAAVLASFNYAERMIIAERLILYFTFVPGWFAIALEAGFDQAQAGRLLHKRLRAIKLSSPTKSDRQFIEFLRAKPTETSHACRGALMAVMDDVEHAFREIAPQYVDDIRERFVSWIISKKGRWR